MSKSSPDSAIFMEDTAAEVNKKVRQAFCPPQEVVGNPCIAYMGMIIFPWCGAVSVARSEANGGPKYASLSSSDCRVAGLKARLTSPGVRGACSALVRHGGAWGASQEKVIWAALHGLNHHSPCCKVSSAERGRTPCKTW